MTPEILTRTLVTLVTLTLAILVTLEMLVQLVPAAYLSLSHTHGTKLKLEFVLHTGVVDSTESTDTKMRSTARLFSRTIDTIISMVELRINYKPMNNS